MAPQTMLSLMYAGIGLLFTAVSIPLVRGRVPRNYIYGFRTPKTLSSDRVWYLANRHAGRDLYLAGLAIAAGSLLMLVSWPVIGLSIDQVAILGLVALGVSLMMAVVRGFRYLSRL